MRVLISGNLTTPNSVSVKLPEIERKGIDKTNTRRKAKKTNIDVKINKLKRGKRRKKEGQTGKKKTEMDETK